MRVCNKLLNSNKIKVVRIKASEKANAYTYWGTGETNPDLAESTSS